MKSPMENDRKLLNGHHKWYKKKGTVTYMANYSYYYFMKTNAMPNKWCEHAEIVVNCVVNWFFSIWVTFLAPWTEGCNDVTRLRGKVKSSTVRKRTTFDSFQKKWDAGLSFLPEPLNTFNRMGSHPTYGVAQSPSRSSSKYWRWFLTIQLYSEYIPGYDQD